MSDRGIVDKNIIEKNRNRNNIITSQNYSELTKRMDKLSKENLIKNKK